MKTGNLVLHAALSAALIAGTAGCHSKSVNAQSGPDPAAANLAQPSTENEAQQQAEQYGGSQEAGQQPPAPIERTYPGAQSGPPPGYSDNGQQPYAGGQSYDQGDQDWEPVYDDSLTDEEANEPPPPLPDYDQPPAPDPDYIWTPGYWAWGPYGYYWVPGCWVAAPYVGALWTPGYWAFVGGVYRFHHGYWGRHIGFYGGINYGFGYFGIGYEGGYWNGPHFYYNTVVTHVNRDRVRDVYVHNVTENRGGARVSFDGGRGGLQVRPRPAEITAMHEQRYAPMQSQVQLRQQASQNRQQFFNANHGRPAEAVAARPVMSDHRMPAEMPRAAVRPNVGGRPEEGRHGQFQQGRPEFRTPQQGGQYARPVQPQNEVRPQSPQQPQNGRPQFEGRGQYQGRPQQQTQPQQVQPQQQQRQQQRPDFRGQQGRPDFQQRQEQMRQQQAQPQPQAQPQQRPDFRGQQGRPEFQQRQEMRQQSSPQVQPQAQPQQRPQFQQRPEQQMRQQGPPPQQRQAPPPQAQRQGPPPPQQHQGGPPQQHDNNGHGDGHDQDRH